MRSNRNRLVCLLDLALPVSASTRFRSIARQIRATARPGSVPCPARVRPCGRLRAGHQLCTLQVPAMMPTDSQVMNGAEMKRKMYAFLWDLVPDSMRGKEMGRYVLMMGAFSVSTVEYEHVMISEANYANEAFDSIRNTITVRFHSVACQQPTAQ